MMSETVSFELSHTLAERSYLDTFGREIQRSRDDAGITYVMHTDRIAVQCAVSTAVLLAYRIRHRAMEGGEDDREMAILLVALLQKVERAIDRTLNAAAET